VLEKCNKSYKYKCFVQNFVYNLMVTICLSMYLSSHHADKYLYIIIIYYKRGVFEISRKSNVNSTGRTDPKKSVIGTFAGSL